MISKSLSENCKRSCGAGFWLSPRRRGPSIPKPGCKDRANAGRRQKARRGTLCNFRTGSKSASRIAVFFIAAILSLCGSARASAAVVAFSAEELDFFERKIRPVLIERCYQCHSAQSEKLKGGFRVDSREALLKGGDTRPALVPGAAEKSLLISAIRYSDENLQMPPKGKLSDQQIADFTLWIEKGAPWPASEMASSGTAPPANNHSFNLAERARHWSFQPLRPPSLPKVQHADWGQSPIDHFVLARLEAAGLPPADRADKRTLIRRVTFDLIGLPPTPSEIDEFLADNSAGAFRKVVERLLASPHYGERWARHWLDLVRFAETAGHEFDFDYPTAYRYRDYVIRAFNLDLPYDQFVIEHIAGDLLPQPRRHPVEGFNESVIGTAFWFLGESVHSPVDVIEDETARMENQIDVYGKTFLGLTLACARCHDHKFDPITAKDYYALAGYLQSSRYQEAFLDPPERFRGLLDKLRDLDAQTQPLAADWLARSAEFGTRQNVLLALANRIQLRAESGVTATESPAELPASETLNSSASPAPEIIKIPSAIVAKWTNELAGARQQPHHPLHPLAMLSANAEPQSSFTERKEQLLRKVRDQAGAHSNALAQALTFARFDRPDFGDWFVTGEAFGESPTRRSVFRFDTHERQPVRSIISPGLAHSGRISSKLEGALRSQTFTIEKDHIWFRVGGSGGTVNLIIDGFQQIRAPIYGGLTFKVNSGERLIWRNMEVSTWKGHKAYIEFLDNGDEDVSVEAVHFADTKAPSEAPCPLALELLMDPAVKSIETLADRYQELFSQSLLQCVRSSAHAQVAHWLLQSGLVAGIDNDDPHLREHNAKLFELAQERRQIESALPRPARVMAIADGTPENQRLYVRGNHRSPGDEIPRRFLEVLRGTNQLPSTAGSGRLGLAERMVDPSNPLLARVMVNRIWKHHFGQGIVATPDDFGKMGQPPSHPELLEYLATQFIEQGWSIKAMHRLVLLSSTYQMSSNADPKADEADPNNRLLHRMPILRLEAEIIRDAILALSGRLEPRFHGPSVAVHLTDFMNGRGRPEKSGPLDGNGRRSIYLNVRRNFLNPMFLAFDYPVPFSTMGRRTVSNVPAQALTLMNNPFVIEQATLWAKRLLTGAERSTDERIRSLYVSAFARFPDAEELAAARQFILDRSAPEANAPHAGVGDELGAWRDLCHVLFNVKEFTFIN